MMMVQSRVWIWQSGVCLVWCVAADDTCGCDGSVSVLVLRTCRANLACLFAWDTDRVPSRMLLSGTKCDHIGRPSTVRASG
jgi:hypothetical protein